MVYVNSSVSNHRQLYVEIKKTKPRKYYQYEAINYKELHKSMEKAGIQESNDDFTRLEKLIQKCMEESKVIKTKIMNEPQK
ncbi:unnamed protein product [Parnassius apollo]|uniref:(apollo) hypothetical protein n=1 Tax=Parnassius apollo TaxID=110799 RepID=A0A8S3WYX2_PARAO|nr:unnamed protein product [Parnassius apollo]